MRYQQDLQVSLRERLRRLMVASAEDAAHEVRLVTDWISQQAALRAVLAEAEQAEPGLDPGALVSALDQGGAGISRYFRWPSQSEGGRALLIWQLMLRIAADDAAGGEGPRIVINYAHGLTGNSKFDDMWREFAERIIRPLFDYVDERIGAESSVLYVLERYVRRVEWFDRAELHARAMLDTRKAEAVYDAGLRRFLFGEGINMPFSQARSASGLSDVLTDLDTGDPLICELKLFDGASRGKRYLASGITQALQYASDYSKQVAYLVIINLSGRPLSFPAEDHAKTWPPSITVAGVRVYLVAVRALPMPSASKQGRPAPITISHDDLIDPDATDKEDPA
jgi:hypothetical protein